MSKVEVTPGDGGELAQATEGSSATAVERMNRGRLPSQITAAVHGPRLPSQSGAAAVTPPPRLPSQAAAPAVNTPQPTFDRTPGPTAIRQQAVGLHAAIPTPSTPITVRLGRYQIVDRIATGGMAEVYLAVHGELAGFRTPVVLKKVLPHLANNPQFIDMFLDEARIASLLDHPNVVRIIEVGRSGNEYFLAMELVQGKSLSAILRRAAETEAGRVDTRLAALIIAQAAAGLHHAHNLTDPLGNMLGLVHRDVSPQNLLLSFEGSVKVIDFGIARALGRITATQTGGMKGKFGYMSPEQARGEEVDLRTDIFALGVVLWESVTGKRLFSRENDLATMRALVYEPIPRPSSVAEISPELEAIVMRALARNPKLRFSTARELANALEKWIFAEGGASASDLAGMMKGYFSADQSTWQQTLRTAVNLPAITEADLALTPAPAIPITNAGQPNRGRRWPYLLVSAGLLGAAVATTLSFTRPPEASPPPVPTSAGPAISAPAPTEPVTPPPPPAIYGAIPAPAASEATPTGSNAEAKTDAKPSKHQKKKRQSNPGGKGGPSGGAAPRPNPF